MAEKIYHLGVKALLNNGRGQFLVLKVNQAHFKGPKGHDYWDIPGGRVLDGDTIEETLLREVAEETGLSSLASCAPLDTVVSPIEIPLENGRMAGLVLTIYTCEAPQNNADIDLSVEHTAYAWVSKDEAAELLAHKYPASFTEKVRALRPVGQKEP